MVNALIDFRGSFFSLQVIICSRSSSLIFCVHHFLVEQVDDELHFENDHTRYAIRMNETAAQLGVKAYSTEWVYLIECLNFFYIVQLN